LLTHLTDTLTLLITNLYVSTGLLGILLAMTIESCCIPLPSEIVMPLAGIMIASGKLLQGVNSIVALILVALAGALGCLLGSVIAYGIGYKGGRPLMLKYGRYVLISQHDADLADKFFQRWGTPTAFFSRLLPVVRTYISLPAGIAKMPFVKFCIYTFLGSFPFCLLLAYAGTILGSHMDKLSPIFHTLDGVIAAAVVILLVLYIWRHIRNDRKARAAHAIDEAVGQQDRASAFAPQGQWGQQQPQQPQFPQYQQQAPAQSGWGQPQQPQQQWSQPQQQQPQIPQQPSPQPGWGQPQQPQWNQQQPQQPQFPQQAPTQSGWGQPQQPQQQQWGQQPPQYPQQPAQPGWGQSSPQQPQQSGWRQP
jgi:membrane protein DedA with SNARE-associated domain